VTHDHAAKGLTANWEVHAADIVVHAAVTDGSRAVR
jgi:hypothetical protein